MASYGDLKDLDVEEDDQCRAGPSVRVQGGQPMKELNDSNLVSFEEQLEDDYEETEDTLDNAKNQQFLEIVRWWLDGKGPGFNEMNYRGKKLVEDGKVTKSVFRAGGGVKIDQEAKVFFHLCAIAEGANEPFDSTIMQGKVGVLDLQSDQEILKGFEMGLLTMSVGEISLLRIHSDYAFGPNGNPPRVLGGTNLLYFVQIVDVIPGNKRNDIEFMTPCQRNVCSFEELFGKARDLRDKGNQLYERRSYRSAADCYRKAASFLEEYTVRNEEDNNRRAHLAFVILINHAQVSLKENKPNEACSLCEKALRYATPEDAKLYCKLFLRFATAKFMLGSYREAKALCVKAIGYDQTNTGPQNLLKSIEHKLKDLDQETLVLSAKLAQVHLNSNSNS